MISNQEKGEKLHNVIERLSCNQNENEAVTDLHELLLEDCNGILYKYMPFRDYTIPTIKEATLYCSSPFAFNDPFDCKIGLDYHSLIETMYLKEFDDLELWLRDYLALRNGEITLDSIPIERIPAIEKWKKSKKLEEFLATANDANMTLDEVNTYLFDNFEVVCEIMEPLIDKMAEKNGMPITTSMFPKLVDNMTEEGKLIFQITVSGCYRR